MFFLVAGVLPFLFIYLNADKLGWFYLFLQLGHLALLSGVGKYLNDRKELREIRMLLQDDEMFFAMYPKERKRDERARRRSAAQLEKSRQRSLRQREKALRKMNL